MITKSQTRTLGRLPHADLEGVPEWEDYKVNKGKQGRKAALREHIKQMLPGLVEGKDFDLFQPPGAAYLRIEEYIPPRQKRAPATPNLGEQYRAAVAAKANGETKPVKPTRARNVS